MGSDNYNFTEIEAQILQNLYKNLKISTGSFYSQTDTNENVFYTIMNWPGLADGVDHIIFRHSPQQDEVDLFSISFKAEPNSWQASSLAKRIVKLDFGKHFVYHITEEGLRAPIISVVSGFQDPYQERRALIASFFGTGFYTTKVFNKIFHFTRDQDHHLVLHSIFEVATNELTNQKTYYKFNGSSLLTFYEDKPLRVSSQSQNFLLNTLPFQPGAVVAQWTGFPSLTHSWLVDLENRDTTKSTIVQEDTDILVGQPLIYTEYRPQLIIESQYGEKVGEIVGYIENNGTVYSIFRKVRLRDPVAKISIVLKDNIPILDVPTNTYVFLGDVLNKE